MKNDRNNFAYIDGANLHKGAKSIGLDLDYERFYTWLGFKYGITDAYIFIGMVSEYAGLYNYLQRSGFKVIFKEVIFDGNGKPKGNCDADLVLRVISDFYERKTNKAILVSSDGDYASTIRFLIEKGKPPIILSPSDVQRCSILLKRTGAKISYMRDFMDTIKKQL
ncbi:MAG: NYN domain-containing protein [Nanoarchaeota archaeon]|nr:NYN domain-containing protein [Nanoarchaeota archaeon]